MAGTITRCELRFVKSRKRWHFHLVDDEGNSLYQSSGAWVDAERGECERVARVFVATLYRGAYRVVTPKAERRKVQS